MKLRDFDLNLLLSFDALLKENSVSKAAERMFITQSAMSHALNRLRELLDDPILVRTSEGMKPTPKATSMKPQVRGVLREIKDMLGRSNHFHPSTSKHQFLIEAADYMEYMLLPPLMERNYHEAPGIDIQVKKPEPDFPEKAMDEGSIDILLALDKDIDPPERFSKEILFEDERVCLLREDHPLAKGKLTIQHYVELDHMRISPVGNKLGAIDEALFSKGLERRIRMIVPHFLYAPHILSTTDMIMSPPLRIAKQLICFCPLKIKPMPFKMPPYHISMAWSPIREKDPAHIWLRSQIRKVGEEL